MLTITTRSASQAGSEVTPHRWVSTSRSRMKKASPAFTAPVRRRRRRPAAPPRRARRRRPSPTCPGPGAASSQGDQPGAVLVMIDPLLEAVGRLRKLPVVQVAIPRGDLGELLDDPPGEVAPARVGDEFDGVAVGVDVVVPDPGLGAVALDQVVDAREDRPVLPRIRAVARDRFARLREPFPVGDVQELEQAEAAHPLAVEPEQAGARLQGPIEMEAEMHGGPLPGLVGHLVKDILEDGPRSISTLRRGARPCLFCAASPSSSPAALASGWRGRC